MQLSGMFNGEFTLELCRTRAQGTFYSTCDALCGADIADLCSHPADIGTAQYLILAFTTYILNHETFLT